jgi:hypothetical protein
MFCQDNSHYSVGEEEGGRRKEGGGRGGGGGGRRSSRKRPPPAPPAVSLALIHADVCLVCIELNTFKMLQFYYFVI